MSFADFDWNRVFVHALIGGAVGGLVGLFVWLGKKAAGGGTRTRDRDPDDDE